MRVPATAATVATASFASPSPGARRHTVDVDDAHAAVTQLVEPSRHDGVASNDPKPSPDRVKLHPALVTALLSLTKLTTGAGEQRARQIGNSYSKNPAAANCH